MFRFLTELPVGTGPLIGLGGVENLAALTAVVGDDGGEPLLKVSISATPSRGRFAI